MRLRNPFSNETRLLFLDIGCYECGRTDQREANHTRGRVSSSPFNLSILCPYHHSKVGHTLKEERRLFRITFYHLKRIGYQPDDNDIAFLKRFGERLDLPKLAQKL